MTRATSFKGLWGNLRFLVVWKTWAAQIVFGIGLALGAAWCLTAAHGGQLRDGAERLDSGDGTPHCSSRIRPSGSASSRSGCR